MTRVSSQSCKKIIRTGKSKRTEIFSLFVAKNETGGKREKEVFVSSRITSCHTEPLLTVGTSFFFFFLANSVDRSWILKRVWNAVLSTTASESIDKRQHFISVLSTVTSAKLTARRKPKILFPFHHCSLAASTQIWATCALIDSSLVTSCSDNYLEKKGPCPIFSAKNQ